MKGSDTHRLLVIISEHTNYSREEYIVGPKDDCSICSENLNDRLRAQEHERSSQRAQHLRERSLLGLIQLGCERFWQRQCAYDEHNRCSNSANVEGPAPAVDRLRDPATNNRSDLYDMNG